MSLLDRKAPHTVLVQKRGPYIDTGGRRVIADQGEPIPHRCAVEPARDWSSAEEAVANGLQVLDLRVIYSREWEGDVYSHVIIDGDVFEMVGAPQPFNKSRRTSHWRITVRRIGKVEP